MNQLDKKEPVQAILIADSFNDCFVPFSDRKPLVSLILQGTKNLKISAGVGRGSSRPS